jgi:general secretion pathway protein G
LTSGGYPKPEEGLAALVTRPGDLASWRGLSLKGNAVPADPWGQPYHYQAGKSEGRPYELFSRGADGQPGGEGENSDVYSLDFATLGSERIQRLTCPDVMIPIAARNMH